LSRVRGEDQRVGDPKGIQRFLTVFLATFARNQGISRKLYEIQRNTERKGGKDSDGASTSGKSDQARVVEEADEDSCDILTAESGKDKYSDAWLLDLGYTYHMYPKRGWFSTYKSYDRGSVLMRNDAVCKTVGISNIRIRMFDGQVRTLTNVRHVLNLMKNLLSL